jgi:predicted membrane GTPase involved in stress response
LLEVTPKTLRLRKRSLTQVERLKASRKQAKAGAS